MHLFTTATINTETKKVGMIAYYPVLNSAVMLSYL